MTDNSLLVQYSIYIYFFFNEKTNKQNKTKREKENYYIRPTSKLIESSYFSIYVQYSIINEIALY